MVWKQREFQQFEFGSEVTPATAQLLSWFGLQSLDQAHRMRAPVLRSLQDPLSIFQMGEAVQRFVTAFEQQETIAIYGDFDLDGSSGLALLYDGLRQLGFSKILRMQPSRLKDGYGFHSHLVEQLAAQGTQLILTVDVGITGNEAAKKARELGIDVIISDHHQCSVELPEVLAILNPHQPGDDSNLKYLCGVGVGFYFMRALKRAMTDAGHPSAANLNLKSLLDFFIIGTLTDLVPLIEDNRTLIKVGLEQLAQTQRPGLVALLRKLSLLGTELTSQDVAIRFAPKLNALSRLETELRPIDIFLAQDSTEANKLVSQTLQLNEKRQEIQKDAERISTQLVGSGPKEGFIFVESDSFHRGVIGLVATKLVQDFSVPAFVGSRGDKGTITGSVRNVDGFPSVLEALRAGESHLNRFGGHAAAAGFEIEHAKIEDFKRALKEFYGSIPETPTDVVRSFDLRVNLEQLDADFCHWYFGLGPYGTDFGAPLIAIQDLVIESTQLLKSAHLKFRLKDPRSNQTVSALSFNCPNPEFWKLGQRIDLLCECQKSSFRGRTELQLLVKEMRLSHAESI